MAKTSEDCVMAKTSEDCVMDKTSADCVMAKTSADCVMDKTSVDCVMDKTSVDCTLDNSSADCLAGTAEGSSISYKTTICWKDRLDPKYLTDELVCLSKNQQKKLLKKRMFEERRLEKRKFERERKKKKRLELREAGVLLPKREKRRDMKTGNSNEIKIAIDLNFTDLMTRDDLRMVVKQVKSCYAENRKIEHPFQLYVTSFCDKFKDIFTSLQPGCVNWDVFLEERDFLDIFDLENIVYLTSDSANVLETLEKEKVYIIGGLVDHNHHKGLCYKLAQEKGISHAQLPIGQYMKLNTRKVLTINHVFEILVRYHESRDWKEAFFKVIPKRKGGKELEEDVLQENNMVKDASKDGGTENVTGQTGKC